MVESHGVAVIPGSFCGFPGWIRVCYSNLSPEECQIAAARLAKGILALCGEDANRDRHRKADVVVQNLL